MQYDFSFNGVKASVYGVVLGSIDDASENNRAVVNITQTTVRRRDDNGFELTNSYSENPLTFENIGVVKSDCHSTTINQYFDKSEMKKILTWLTSTKNGELKVYTNDNEYLLMYGMFYEIDEIQVAGSPIGYTLKFKSDSPYTKGNERITNASNTTTTTVSLDNYSFASRDYLYPTSFVVTTRAGGDLTIENDKDPENDIIIKGCSSGEVITIDCLNGIISSSDTSATRKIYNNYNFNFPRIVRDRKQNISANKFTSNIACDFKIIYTPLYIGCDIFG